MKLSHTKLIIISGLIWFAIGFYLLQLGINLLLSGVQQPIFDSTHYPFITAFKSLVGSTESAVVSIIILALFIGYAKGRFVLGKSAQKGVSRILSLPNPAPLSQIYDAKYYILLGLMIFLGISIKYIGLNHDIRGFIDAAIGAALINGAVIYFRLAQSSSAQASNL